MKYKVVCRVYFASQDGYDYMDHDDEEIYNSKDEAIKVMRDYRIKDMLKCNHEYHIEEVEE